MLFVNITIIPYLFMVVYLFHFNKFYYIVPDKYFLKIERFRRDIKKELVLIFSLGLLVIFYLIVLCPIFMPSEIPQFELFSWLLWLLISSLFEILFFNCDEHV